MSSRTYFHLVNVPDQRTPLTGFLYTFYQSFRPTNSIDVILRKINSLMIWMMIMHCIPESLEIFEKPTDELTDSFDVFVDNIVLDHKK